MSLKSINLDLWITHSNCITVILWLWHPHWVFHWGPSVWLAAMLNKSETPLFPKVTPHYLPPAFQEVTNWNSGNDFSLFFFLRKKLSEKSLATDGLSQGCEGEAAGSGNADKPRCSLLLFPVWREAQAAGSLEWNVQNSWERCPGQCSDPEDPKRLKCPF